MTTLNESEKEYETNDGTQTTSQFSSTVPKRLVEAMGWEGGDELEWNVEAKGKLSVQKDE